MSIPDVNLIAILVSVVLSFVVGGLWYGPVFGNGWMKNKGLTKEDVSDGGSSMFYTVISSLVGMIIAAIFIGYSGAENWFEGTTIGLLLATFAGSLTFNNVVYDKTKGIGNRFKDWFLHLGYMAVYLAIAGAILAVWR